MSIITTAQENHDNAATLEYMEHPNFYVISAFSLGWLFMCSFYLVARTALSRNAYHRGRRFLRRLIRETSPSRAVDLGTLHGDEGRGKEGVSVRSIQQVQDQPALTFILNLSFLSASLSQFATILTFRGSSGWNTGCAFVVAWGGMASQAACLVSSTILSLELARRKVWRWELLVLWVGLFATLALGFAVNALSTGLTSFVPLMVVHICHRGHSLPISLALSITQLCLNGYMALRLSLLKLCTAPRATSIAAALGERAPLQAFSIVLFHLLTLVPNAIRINLVAQFVPHSIGGLIVLAAFNSTPSSTTHISPLTSFDDFPTASRIFHQNGLVGQPGLHISTSSNLSTSTYPIRQSVPASATSNHTFASDISTSGEPAIAIRSVGHVTSGPQAVVASVAHGNYILPSQTAFAEQLEREETERFQHNGPNVRHWQRNQALRIIVQEDDDDVSEEFAVATFGSAPSVIGSDIIYTSPTAPSARSTLFLHSSAYSASPKVLPHKDTLQVVTPTSDDGDGPEGSRSSMTSHSIYVTDKPSLKSPARSVRHFSFSSHRIRSREGLPAVPEVGNEYSFVALPDRSHRDTFGRPPRATTPSEVGLPSMPTLRTHPTLPTGITPRSGEPREQSIVHPLAGMKGPSM